MNLRTWVRVLIAGAISISGLVETLSATGLVVELSPDGRWGSGVHTLAVSGPLQLMGAALLASGRKTRWALRILGCYVFLTSVFGNLPLIFNPNVGGSAITGLLGNLVVMGGILYWLRSERMPSAHEAEPALPMTNPAPVLPVRLVVCQNSSDPLTPTPGQVTRHAAALPRRSCSSLRSDCEWKNQRRVWQPRPGRLPATRRGNSVSMAQTAWCRSRASQL